MSQIFSRNSLSRSLMQRTSKFFVMTFEIDRPRLVLRTVLIDSRGMKDGGYGFALFCRHQEHISGERLISKMAYPEVARGEHR
jgi:hypothetical protein